MRRCVDVRRYEAFVFDLDGTVYLGDEPIPGAVATLNAIRASGKRFAFVSNNPLHTPEEYAAKLNRMGILCDVTDVVTSVMVTARYFARLGGSRRVYPIAEELVVQALEQVGCTIVDDPTSTDFVLVSWDRTFTYQKLDIATQALRMGAKLLATHPDPTCPVRYASGRVPDAGALLAAVETSSGVTCQEIFGKPSHWMARFVLDHLNVEPHQVLVVGDRAETDAALALHNGMDAALVLTGVSRPSDAEALGLNVHYVLPSVAHLLTEGGENPA